MKKAQIGFFITLLALFGFSNVAQGAIYNVSDSASFQSALTTAQNNSEDDTINIAAGNYNGNFTYTGVPGTGSLTIIGAGAETTILDGGGSDRVLYIYNFEGTDISLQGIKVENGRIENGQGAGLHALVSNGDIEISDCILSANTHGGVGSGGGAYIMVWNYGNISVNNSSFTNNSSNSNGAGAYIGILQGGDITLTDNNFINNTATSGHGGGVFTSLGGIASGLINYFNNTFIDNRSYDAGGASVAGEDVEVLIVNNVFAGNIAEHNGGGIGLSFNNSLIFTNNTVTDNSASLLGAGIYIDNFDFDDIIADIYNSIIWGNKGSTDIYIESGGTANFYNNDFSTITSFWITVIEDSNLDLDPLFVSNTQPYNLNLQQTSQLIDMGENGAPGIPSADRDGNPRIQDGDGDGQAVVDIGAYELNSSSTEPGIEEIIDFFDQGVEDGTITSTAGFFWGQIQLSIMRQHLTRARDAIERGSIGAACWRLRRAYLGCDGEGYDLVKGEDVGELAQSIYGLAVSLDCWWTAN